MSISFPSADFAPTLSGYTGQGSFRFWCQKVLPIVYDDSLSYYELLNKVVVYLNNVISDVASVEDNMALMYDAYSLLQGYVNDVAGDVANEINTFEEYMQQTFDELQSYVDSYFDNLNVQNEINRKLDQMATDGSLTALLVPLMVAEAPAIIKEWMDENITPTSPVVDASLTISGAAADAKVTGVVRGDVKEIEGVTIKIDRPVLISNSSVNDTDGSFEAHTGWSRTDYIPVDPTTHVEITANAEFNYNAMYDENHDFIGVFGVPTGTSIHYFREGTRYIALSGVDSAIEGVTLRTYILANYFAKVDDLIGSRNPIDLFPLSGFKSGTLNNGVVTDSWVRAYSDYVEAEPFTMYLNKRGTEYMCFAEEYDSNKTFLRASNYLSRNSVYTTGDRTAFIRFVVSHLNTSLYVDPGESVDFDNHFIKVDSVKNMRLMTYNMGHYAYGTGVGLPADIYDEKLENYNRFFRDMGIDILGIQEYDSRMDAENTIWSDDVLFNNYFKFNQNTGSATALKSKLPLLNSQYGQLSTGRYYCDGIIATNEKPIYALVVHLSVGTANRETRAVESYEIIDMLRNHGTCILFGDFNPEPGEEDELFGIFANAGYSIGNCGWYGKKYTWSNPRSNFDHYDNPSDGSILYYIDNIITTPDVSIRDIFPLPTAYSPLSSDHIPFVADVDILDDNFELPDVNLFAKIFRYNVKPNGTAGPSGVYRALSLPMKIDGAARIIVDSMPTGLQYSVCLYSTPETSSYTGYADSDWHTGNMVYTGGALYIRMFFGFANGDVVEPSTFDSVRIKVYKN